jgi:prepilin peptidase CpaA
MFRDSTASIIAGAIFTALLLVAGWSDFRSRRIPNLAVLALLVGGLAFSMASMPLIEGLGFALGGVVTGFLVWIPFHALGWIGAGDVKLAAACGAWLGWQATVHASIAGAIVGGALALAMLLYQRSLKGTATDLLLIVNTIVHRPSSLRVRPETVTAERSALMPYGVALVIGALAVGWFGV